MDNIAADISISTDNITSQDIDVERSERPANIPNPNTPKEGGKYTRFLALILMCILGFGEYKIQ